MNFFIEKLGLGEVDLFLIHWPLPLFDQYVETWRALEQLLADRRVRSIGVWNFEIEHLETVGRAVSQNHQHRRLVLNRKEFEMRRMSLVGLLVLAVLTSCTSGTTRPEDQSATTLLNGAKVFVVEPVDLDCPANASCSEQIWVGANSYVYPYDTNRTFKAEAISNDPYAVGGVDTKEFIEVRTLDGVPAEYALAARLVGTDEWVAVGGHPVEATEMDEDPELANKICDALQERVVGWSFCTQP